MKGHGEKLSRNQKRAISALLVHPTMTQAAESAGIGEVTLWRWLRIPTFKEQYRLARREAVRPGRGTTPGGLQRRRGGADVFRDVNCPASARVSAARTVLELALKGVELEDLVVRVEELELQAARA